MQLLTTRYGLLNGYRFGSKTGVKTTVESRVAAILAAIVQRDGDGWEENSKVLDKHFDRNVYQRRSSTTEIRSRSNQATIVRIEQYHFEAITTQTADRSRF